MRNKNLKNTFFYPALIFLFAVSIAAQTTEFMYQGKLTDNGSPASGGYLLQFKLFDAVSGGTQIGATISDVAVTATNGVFTAQLDFGVTPFNGADRFLEIAVKKNAGDSYTVLNPRQQITSSPYSIRTLSAAQADVALDANKLGGVDANQYVTTSSVGNSFIKNSTTTQTANFNISGNGIVGGNLGIGTTTPRAKFHVVGSSWFQGDSTPLPAAAGKGIVVGFGGEQGYIQAFDYGAFTPKNLLLNNSGGNVGIGTINPQAKLHVAGNAIQDRDKGGMMKAMLYVSGDGTLIRCYNGFIGTSTANCGFSVIRRGSGSYEINFGHVVSDRFFSVTTTSSAIVGNINQAAAVYFDFRLPNTTVLVRTFATNETQTTSESSFFFVVY